MKSSYVKRLVVVGDKIKSLTIYSQGGKLYVRFQKGWHQVEHINGRLEAKIG